MMMLEQLLSTQVDTKETEIQVVQQKVTILLKVSLIVSKKN